MSKKNKKSKNKVVKQDTGAQTISRLLTVAILAGIGFSVYQDVYADDSRYVTDQELLEINQLEQEAIEIEKQYQGLPKQITVCWSAEKQRLVPVYQGCK